MRRMQALVAALALVLLVAAVGGAFATAGSKTATPSLKRERALHVPTPQAGPAPLAEATTTIQRTFVSTSGSDASPCTRAEPCRGFATAIANTTAGGEVVALDSGGYGAFTINKSVTIAGAPGEHVAITTFSGTGINIFGGAFDTVTLRNLYVTGLGGQDGIFHQTGTLNVESCVVTGFSSAGLVSNAWNNTLVVTGSRFRGNGNIGMYVTGGAAFPIKVEVADTRADKNGTGFVFFNAKGSVVRSAAARNDDDGFRIHVGSKFAVADSSADGNGGDGVDVADAGTDVVLSGMVLSNNVGAGLGATFNGGIASIGGSTVTGNGVGLEAANGGILESFSDNLVRGNTTNTAGPLLPIFKT